MINKILIIMDNHRYSLNLCRNMQMNWKLPVGVDVTANALVSPCVKCFKDWKPFQGISNFFLSDKCAQKRDENPPRDTFCKQINQSRYIKKDTVFTHVCHL